MDRYDLIVIGGGFYGCCIAERAASRSRARVLVIEAGPSLMQRASSVNQARIHTGYHYPRSFVTAARSFANRKRFTVDFPEAVVDGFTMLYGIASVGSKVSPERFRNMFASLGAKVAPASDIHRSLFDPARIAAVFECEEYAFDWTILRDLLSERMRRAGVEVALGNEVERVVPSSGGLSVETGSGFRAVADRVVNAAYAGLNGILLRSGETTVGVKYEVAEMALCEPPPALADIGITVMDGPFFSFMPYPSAGRHSLSHVRYTPRFGWREETRPGTNPYVIAGDDYPVATELMRRDASRYVPSLADVSVVRTVREVKAVLERNEVDDGRPILMRRHPSLPGLTSVLGGKIDNVYDLLDAMDLG